MELDRELLSQIRNMNDADLEKSIEAIARSMGFDPKMAKHYLGDPGKVRETVEQLSERDLARITSALGQEKTEQLVQDIRKQVKG